MQSFPPGLHLKGSVFHLRIGIPDKVRHLWPRQKSGKLATDAFRASLKTSDRAEAIKLAHKLWADYLNKFQVLEDGARPAPYVTLTPSLARQFGEAVRHLVLQADDNVTFYTPDHEQQTLGRKGQRRAYTADLTALKRGDLQAAQAYAERIAESWGLRIDWSSPEGRRCLIQIAREVVSSWQDVARRKQGEPIDTPPAPEPPVIHTETPGPAQEVEDKPMTLRDVVPSWERRTNAKADAKKRTQRALALFEAAVGTLPLADLTKGVGARFVRFLLDAEARGFKANTASKYASAINALVEVAIKDDDMERNPFDLTIDTAEGSQTREAWTDDELARMFGHYLFSDRMGEFRAWHNVTPTDGRAALLILMHTGARIGEIAQLRREDFQTRSGMQALRITAEAGAVKTKESERGVPLAEHLLVDPWFAQWFEGITGGTGPAFPSLHGRERNPGDTLGQWFNRFRKDAGLPEGALNGSHKFRHWMRAALAEKQVGVETADSITGHTAQGSSGRVTYTPAASPRAMKEALDRVDYPKIISD
ncbi:tyrosine-type recombinase/integrase [Burkholderia stagnalis]|uniref:tyrosine-type recombinase/integrase n=1 Tax=Burkholderia stagnalis TaxID=1503054 RepID=UPI0016399CF4|nr:tyrosine-type recombinase/integrase [Burkholderia stagnalis]